MEGVRHSLEEQSNISTEKAALAFAMERGIDTMGKPDTLERIQRIAAALHSNPGLVNTSRPLEV